MGSLLQLPMALAPNVGGKGWGAPHGPCPQSLTEAPMLGAWAMGSLLQLPMALAPNIGGLVSEQGHEELLPDQAPNGGKGHGEVQQAPYGSAP